MIIFATQFIFNRLMAKNTSIIIKGARVNNLKNIDVEIPRNKLVVITGLSGSGKSSLAFDTLYAEGQRRYVESLSSYARQFLGRMSKPECDFIKGIPPAIAIEHAVHDVLGGVFLYLLSADRTESPSHTGVEQAQVFVDFSLSFYSF